MGTVEDARTLLFFDAHTQRFAERLTELVRLRPQKPNLSFLSALTFHGLYPRGSDTAFEGITLRFDENPNEFRDRVLADLTVGRTVVDGALQLRRALEHTIERSLGSAKRVAVLTGGGLDSGGLLTLVDGWAKRSGRSYFALAMDFADRGDDRPYLRALEEKLRCEVLRVPPEDGAHHPNVLGAGADCRPMFWPTAAIEYAAIVRGRENGADVVVSGAGGDALFDGVARGLSDLARAEGVAAAWRAARTLRGFGSPRSRLWSWVVRPLMVESIPRRLRSKLVRPAAIHEPPWMGLVARKETREYRRRRRAELRALVGSGELPLTDLDQLLAGYRQHCELVTGVRRVEPYLDLDLRRFCSRLPRHWVLVGGLRRGLFREALRDLLPPTLYARPDKAHFEAAFLRLVRSAWGFDHLRDLARAPTLASFGIVEPGPFLSKFEELVADPFQGPLWPQVWPVLAMEGFARAHFGRPT